MSFTRDTIRVSAQTAIYDLCRAGFLLVVLSARPWLETQATAMGVPGAVAWSTLLLLVLAFASIFVYDWWRSSHVGAPIESLQRSDQELAVYFNQQVNEAITEIRDKVGKAVSTPEDLAKFCKLAGRWFGRNEDRARTVEERFPTEVSAFLVHGEYIKVLGSADPIRLQANHLQSHVTAKVRRLRDLAKALQGGHSASARALTSECRAILVRSLQQGLIPRVYVWFGHYVSVADGPGLAVQLADAFSSAGWQASAGKVSSTLSDATGIRVSGHQAETRSRIVQALQSAGIDAEDAGGGNVEGPIDVIVGA